MERFKSLIISPNGIRQSEMTGVIGLDINASLDNDDSIFYYQRRISGTLIFIGEDYKHLLNWSQSNKRYEKCTLVVYEKVAGIDKQVLRTTIYPDDVKWDVDKCTCSIKIEKLDSKFDPYDLIKDVDLNIFEMATPFGTWEMADAPPPGGFLSMPYTVANGLNFLNVLEGMLKKAYGNDMIIKSEFFNWRATRLTTIGYENLFFRLVTGSNSDIIMRQRDIGNPVPDPATITKVSLSRLLETFTYMFNLKCDVESYSVFRIEHISWYDTQGGTPIDVTTGSNFILNDGRLSSYEYDNKSRFKEERLNDYIKGQITLNTLNPDINSHPITYDIDNNTKTKSVDSVLTTAIHYIDFVEQGNIIEGMFLAIVDNNTIALRLKPTNGILAYNDVVSWGALVNAYHNTHKSYVSGKRYSTVTETIVNATFTTRQFIVQRGIKVYSDNYTIWLNKLVKTNIGIGRVKAYSKKLGDCYALVDVYFDQIITNNYTTPSAVADTYTFDTSVVSTLNTAAQSLNTLSNNDTSSVTVLAESKPTDIGGSVTILSNGHFIYNRPAGYKGIDRFDYYIILNGFVGTGTCTINIT